MKKIIFLGHSILSLYKKESIGEWKILNVSKQGIIAKEGLQIAENIADDLIVSDAVLIMFGINELYYQMKKETIINYLDQLLVYISNMNPRIRIILSEIIQTDETTRLKPEKILWVNQELQELSKKFQTKILTWEQVYNSDGKISDQNTIDGIHLSKDGYTIFEDCLLELLDK
ncbi:GDSL-type esterase/lipase family protein [Facklamia sp. 7083-14-GEN3]|uniref:SGNH/GDSL hydrolase family protein n=1 Tax=Facklamia sp. 7083-14-GEN3 TaxID=2973478 RepID=UPI00215BDE0A|nr:GDSL-type esterase/lipase family protein [Facklamia sp. 7083-14-GEN3]MCR8968602.1 GDSL-type esterase/lipase family protein [Facklamia sp. 7083-14-GEN3]